MQFDVGITPPDGLNDLERRKKRSSEFASRFSRNYLYQLNRQLSDIKKLLHPSSARISNQNSYVIKQKITSSYQTILQGLQAYLSHLPKSTTVGIPDKIKELLKEIASLCDMHRSYSSTDLNCNVKSNELLDVSIFISYHYNYRNTKHSITIASFAWITARNLTWIDFLFNHFGGWFLGFTRVCSIDIAGSFPFLLRLITFSF